MVVVESLLKLWKAQGHKVLLFSQSKQVTMSLQISGANSFLVSYPRTRLSFPQLFCLQYEKSQMCHLYE